jgi:hypothetical protein
MQEPVNRIRKVYKITTTIFSVAAAAYVLLLTFPQVLFANSMEHGKFRVYSREPIEPAIANVLDVAESKLKASPIYDSDVSRDVYLTNSHAMYAALSHKAYNSFANSVPFINNIFVNKTDIPADLVFVDRDYNNSRSLSGVIAHETIHLFIRERYGTVAATLMPTWKVEGYCEYVAGDSTITQEEGGRRWRENPNDDTRYRYIKYHLMVKHLLEEEKLGVGEMFNTSIDEKNVAGRTFATLADR